MSIGSLVGLSGLILTVSAVGLKIGQWKNEVEDHHDEQEKAHKLVHEDVKRILVALGYDTDSLDECPTCEGAD